MGSQSSCTWQKKAAVPYWVVPELRHVPSLHCRAPAHEHVCWLGTVVLSNKECPYFVCECWLDCYVRTMYIIPFHDDVLNTTTRMCTSGHLLLSGKHNCIHIRTNTYFLMGSVLIHVRSMLSHLRGWFSSHECWTACLAISFCHFSALAWLTSQNRLMSFISIRGWSVFPKFCAYIPCCLPSPSRSKILLYVSQVMPAKGETRWIDFCCPDMLL